MKIRDDTSEYGLPAASKLRDMLTMDDKAGWISIMDFILEHVPYLMRNHRPTNEAVSKSLVRKMGYPSFKAFRKHELKWSDNKWSEMRRAYALVLEHPYLRDLGLSRDAIIEAHKVLGENFPECAEAWNQYIRDKKAEHEQTLSEEKSSNESLQKQLNDCIDESAVIKAGFYELENQCTAYRRQLSDVINQRKHTEVELEQIKITVNNQLKSIRLLKSKLSDAEIEQEILDDVISEREREQKYIFFMALFSVASLILLHLYGP